MNVVGQILIVVGLVVLTLFSFVVIQDVESPLKRNTFFVVCFGVVVVGVFIAATTA